MFRAIIYILASVFLITLLRGIIGVITKGVAQLFEGEAAATGGSSPATRPAGGFGGELLRCSVCGTFAAPSAALTVERGGETHHFCSEACRRKFA